MARQRKKAKTPKDPKKPGRIKQIRQSYTMTKQSDPRIGLILLGVFRAAHRRIQGQQALLLEAERRDPLTELLNHGAVVALLTNSIEHARAVARPLGVALIDIDNFRLMNDTHGHEAADEVLRRVAELLTTEAIAGSFVARYAAIMASQACMFAFWPRYGATCQSAVASSA